MLPFYNGTRLNLTMNAPKSAITSGLCIVLLWVSLLAGQGAAPAPPIQTNRSIRVDVDLVLVNVTVTDRYGRFVQGLSKEHFQVWEDKVEQEIATFSGEDTPVSLGIILDRSGSMGVTKPRATDSRSPSILDEARSYAFECLKDGIREDEYFLVEFSSKAQVVADFTNDLSRLREKLLFVEAGGRTALWDAIYAGVAKSQDGMYTRKALLVLTDGLENNSRYTLFNLKEVLRERDVRIYGVNATPNVQFDGLAQLIELSGGRSFGSSNPCQELAADLKNQYVLGYRPTNRASDGAFRKITVRLDPSSLPKGVSDLSVRARAGYYAAP